MSFISGRVQVGGRLDPGASLPTTNLGLARWNDEAAALGYHPAVAGDSTDYPVHDPVADSTIVASARLDNRTELADRLGASEHLSDGRLILAAYRRWGTECLTHLLGDFAFAIWDGNKQRLFAARDYIGARPFYYVSNHTTFLFSSSAGALIETPGVPKTLDLPYLAAHFRKGQNYPHATHTFYEAIRILPPAHAMVVDRQGPRVWRHWHPDRLADVRHVDPSEYGAQLRELLTTAVATRLPTTGPVAAHVSGGLDCSSIAVVAHRALAAQSRTLYGYCWSPAPEGELDVDDERRLVTQIGEDNGIPIVYAELTVEDRLRAAVGHPVLGRDAVACLHEASLRRHAAAHGVTTILSGWGGDELISFNGRGYLSELLRRGHLRTLWRNASEFADVRARSRSKVLISGGVIPHLPDSVVERFAPGLLPRMWHPMPLPDSFQPGFSAQLAAVTPLPHLADRERPGVRSQQLRLLARNHLAERIDGWSAAGLRHGITYAYPLLDRRIAEFALGLPPEMFFRDGWTRWLYRTAMAGTLPESVAWRRSKANPTVAADLRSAQPDVHLRQLDLLDRILSRTEKCEVLDRARAHQNVRARIKGEPGERGYLNAAVRIESLVNPALAEVITDSVEQVAKC